MLKDAKGCPAFTARKIPAQQELWKQCDLHANMLEDPEQHTLTPVRNLAGLLYLD
ncbi:hypothetical protein ABBQ38_008145 [Trebouxia sp. C0009 RCD-2024]